MTDHMDDGRLQAFLDGELDPAEARAVEARLAAEPELAGRVRQLRASRERVSGLVAALPVTSPDLGRARAAVRRAATRPEGTKGGSGPWFRQADLARAAILVLLLAGVAAAAVPGSPVRSWIEDRLTGPAADPPAAAVAEAGEVSAAARARDGRLVVELHELARGEEIRVELVDGDRGRIRGPAGTRFEGGSGRIRAWSVAGPLEVELPRDADRVELRLEGRLLATVRSGELLPEPGADVRSAEEGGARVFLVGPPAGPPAPGA